MGPMTLFGLPAFQVSAGVLIFLIVLLVLTGRLVPRRQLEDLREDRDARVEAAEHMAAIWQQAYEAAVQSRRASDAHVGQLMETAIVTKDVLQSLPGVPQVTSSEAHLHATEEA
jgi:hypothetical protein